MNNWGCCCLRIRTLRSIHITVIVKVRIQPVVHFELRLLGDFVLSCRHAQAVYTVWLRFPRTKLKQILMFYLGIYLYVWVQLCFSSVSVFVCISSEGSAVYTWEDKLLTQRAHIVVSCARLPCTESSNLILMKYLSFCNFDYSQNTFYYFEQLWQILRLR